MMAADDLAPLLAKQPPATVGFRQGRIIAWNPITAENVIDVAGSLMTDLPILNTAEAGLLAPGDVVGIEVVGSGGAQTWYIKGRITIPNTPQAGSALSAWAARGKLAKADDFVEFSGTTFAAPSDGLGPTITDFLVGNSGQALLFISAELNTPDSSLAQSGTKPCFMGFDLSGPTNLAPDISRSLEINFGWSMPSGASMAAGITSSPTKMVPLTGLAPGTYTIDARYRAGGTGGNAGAALRSLFAVPI